MAKSSNRPEKRGRTSLPQSPAGALSQIRRLDTDLAKLFQQRARLVQKAVELGDNTLPQALNPGADEAIHALAASSAGPLPSVTVEALFRELASGCRSLLRPLKIALLGPLYSYSHLAGLYRFGHSVDYVPVGTIGAVFEEVNVGHSDFGLVPIENSTDGRIADTLDMFTRMPVRICSEVSMHIHHALLGRCARHEILEVYSRPQALSQCRNWLTRHLPGARLIEVTSTTTAAQLAKEKPGAAAIASLQAAAHYGLEVLAERIEDNVANITRFVVIGKESAPRTGRDKCAVLFQTEHRPGALAEAMNIFKRNRLNLTWIESFPVLGMERVYLFFVEMEGHETDARVRRAMMLLGRKTLRLETLGSYPVSETVD